MNKNILQPLVEQGLSQYKIAKRLGKSQTTIRYWLSKYDLKTQKCLRVSYQVCKSCGSKIFDTKHFRSYCNNKCQADLQRKDKIQRGVAGHVCLKHHLIETKGHACEICSTEVWCGKPVPLVMDHIDGNSDNNSLQNLRLVCGNCDMQLPTYKSKNRGKGRYSRRQRYQAGKSY